MDIGSNDGKVVINLGTTSTLHSLYSTALTYGTEASDERPNFALKFLESGECPAARCIRASVQLRRIAKVLDNHAPEDAIWDVDAPELLPPWTDNLSEDIKSCCDLYTTASGEEMVPALIGLLDYAGETQQDVIVFG